MNAQDLQARIATGEDSFTEFKRDISQRSDFAGEMIAFANGSGGQIFVGISDKGEIVGVEDPQRTEEAIVNYARQNCIPPLVPHISRIDTDKGVVLLVDVPQRTSIPHENNNGQCYIRVGSTKRLCTPQERARLLQSAGLYHYEETPVERTTIDNLDNTAFGNYYRLVYERPLDRTEVPLDRMLENMRFLVPNTMQQRNLSVAGLLLFGKQPQDFMYHARISAVRWAGTEAGEEILDRKEITGRLSTQIDDAEKFILRNTRLATTINGAVQTDRYEYPRPAIREALVNAVAHRDYSIEGAQILLYIFDDRIEFRSPGTLPNSVTLDNIRAHYSRPRNELIARVLFNMGYVNTLGSGVPRIIRLLKEANGREPDFEVGSSQFLVRFWSGTPTA